MTPNTCNVENVTHINYHSDFRLIIRFNSDKLPDYPWRITFSTPSTHTVDKYVASFDGENYINCKPVDTLPGAAIVFFDHHRLGCGTLGYILDMDIPDDEFPDGKMDIEIPGVETIELWPGKSDETELPAEIIVALLQMLKGFSPSIEVEEDSEDSYILRITNETGSYLTPNLRASLNLAQSTGDSQYIAMSQDATTKALAEKVDKEEGKGLSTNDYTDQEKEKLAGLSNYDDTEIRKELSDKASKKELTEGAAGTLAEAKSYTDATNKAIKADVTAAFEQTLATIDYGDAATLKESKSYTDTKTAELWNNVGDTFDAMSEELNSNISGGDAQALTEAKNYTDKAISEIPTPDVSGQIERHNTSPHGASRHPGTAQHLRRTAGVQRQNLRADLHDKGRCEAHHRPAYRDDGAALQRGYPIYRVRKCRRLHILHSGFLLRESICRLYRFRDTGYGRRLRNPRHPAQQHRILGQVDTCIAGDDSGQGRPHGASHETVAVAERPELRDIGNPGNPVDAHQNRVGRHSAPRGGNRRELYPASYTGHGR